MCGIAGLIDFKKQSSLQILQQCTHTLLHRGPDGYGFEFYQTDGCQIGLGHRRLSIIDLTEAGHQPMMYDGLTIVFNGEIYNHSGIRKSLEEAGHHFKSHSDTEVILHAYRQWGAEMLQHFIGMFAFVIYDSKQNNIFCCIDRAGVKPFFYFWDGNLFLFGSELKALMAHPAFPKKIDTHALGAYLQMGYVPTPFSIFENTQKLKPGHCLLLNLKDKRIETRQYWNVYDSYNKPTLSISYADAIAETEKLLTNAFQYRMVSDVPVGVFLSGGFDSACVTSLLQANNTQKIKTFTIGVPDAGLNEAPYAKDIAKHLGTDHTEYYCTQKEALEIIPDLPFYYDEPFADSSAIPTTLVCKVARQSVTVALSADAGDEVFAGYNRYAYIMKYGKNLQAIPDFLRKTMAALMDTIPAQHIPGLKKNYLIYNRYEKIKSFLKNPSEQNILINITQKITDAELKKLLKPEVEKLQTAFYSKELQPEHYNLLHYVMAIDYQTYLPDDILHKVDRAGMSVSLEGREPFLDHRIIDWAAQLPIEYKYHKGNKKRILKDIVHQYIPLAMMDRPKMGFGIPLDSWLQNELRPFVEECFAPGFVETQGLFNNDEIQLLKKQFYNGQREKAEKIWFILMFQMWYQKWMH